MQNLTDLIIKALNYDYPEEIPINFWFLPAVMKARGDEVKAAMQRYPAFFGDSWLDYDYEKELPVTYRVGDSVDAWGCVWSNAYEGMEFYVTGHPLPHREGILSLEVPTADMGIPHGYMYLRLLDLRGFEEAMMDFAEECDELQILIDKVCEYNVRQNHIVCKNEPLPLVKVGDDLGMQKGIAIGAQKWRKYMKPAFTKIHSVCKDYGKYLYMHTDGDIIEIMPDIIETGVDIINPQYRANGIDRLEEVCKGKIPIMLDLDRQLFPFCSPQDVRDHLRETIERLYLPQGGLGINIEIGIDVPMDNILALMEEADKMRIYKG